MDVPSPTTQRAAGQVKGLSVICVIEAPPFVYYLLHHLLTRMAVVCSLDEGALVTLTDRRPPVAPDLADREGFLDRKQ